VSDWFKSEAVNMQSPADVIVMALAEHDPIRVFACFSGGNDSAVTTHFSMKRELAHEVFNINTGIGIPEAREHLYRTVDRFNWPLRVKTPPAFSYEQIILKWGFPGPGAHAYPYRWLKERAIEQLVRETKKEFNDRVMLITGVRASESARRMGFCKPVHRDGALVWVAPMYSWSQGQMDDYMEQHKLVRNPVTEKLGISGECLCGAFASPNERKRIARHYPEFNSYLSVLEAQVEDANQPYCRWGNGVRIDPNQGKLDFTPKFMPMCAGCSLLGREQTA
jgi:3'-phosphoadenosine 5'-phosphosulfate sulfotransferase (PAPS reductase)/FAD synthetase